MRSSTRIPPERAADNPLAADLDHVLAHTRTLWEDLRGQRLFITGGTGFFGCWLLESFVWANDKLGLNTSAVVLTRNPEALRRKAPHLASSPAIQLHVGDMCTFEFPAGEFSHVIHAATETGAGASAPSPLDVLDRNIRGTRRVLEFTKACGAKAFLFTSSGAVYGKQPVGMTHVPEEYRGAPDPTDTQSAYGEAKRSAELLCAAYAKQWGIEVKIARGFAFVGPYLPLDAHFAIGNFIRDGMSGGPIVVKGDGTPYRSYLYAADLAIWLWTILFRGTSCRPYNVGSAKDISIGDLAAVVASCFGDDLEVLIETPTVPEKPAERYVPATGRSSIELGLEETVDLPEAVRRTIGWNSQLSGTP